MIARLWSARAVRSRYQAYLEHFSGAVLPALKGIDGYISSSLLIRPINQEVEILVITVWQSLTAIDAFAGADREAAVVAPEAAALLTNFDRRVRHFELAVTDGSLVSNNPTLF